MAPGVIETCCRSAPSHHKSFNRSREAKQAAYLHVTSGVLQPKCCCTASFIQVLTALLCTGSFVQHYHFQSPRSGLVLHHSFPGFPHQPAAAEVDGQITELPQVKTAGRVQKFHSRAFQPITYTVLRVNGCEWHVRRAVSCVYIASGQVQDDEFHRSSVTPVPLPLPSQSSTGPCPGIPGRSANPAACFAPLDSLVFWQQRGTSARASARSSEPRPQSTPYKATLRLEGNTFWLAGHARTSERSAS